MFKFGACPSFKFAQRKERRQLLAKLPQKSTPPVCSLAPAIRVVFSPQFALYSSTPFPFCHPHPITRTISPAVLPQLLPAFRVGSTALPLHAVCTHARRACRRSDRHHSICLSPCPCHLAFLLSFPTTPFLRSARYPGIHPTSGIFFKVSLFFSRCDFFLYFHRETPFLFLSSFSPQYSDPVSYAPFLSLSLPWRPLRSASRV